MNQAGNSDIELSTEIADRVEQFVQNVVVPFETDPRNGPHGPSDELVQELRALARDARVLTPHIHADGSHLSQRGTARVLIKAGWSHLGTLATNVMAPDEGNMYLLGRIASQEQKARYLDQLIDGSARSAFFMTEPASDGGAGSDPSLLQTTATRDGNQWLINGRKAFITGADGAAVGIVMAMAEEGATLFLVDLPNPAIRTERVLDTIDSSMPGGHAVLQIENLRLPSESILGEPGRGFQLAQIRLAPARLSHCMRWTGMAHRAHEIATAYACTRKAFGQLLIDHEGVGFSLAQNQIDLQQCELMIDWCADALDRGESGNIESSMAKVSVSEMLFQIADRCVQVMGGTGVSGDTIVERFFRETRAFRIYDGPTEVHKWSLAKKIKRRWMNTNQTQS
jgi:acyl-CoA dehydrogenase